MRQLGLLLLLAHGGWAAGRRVTFGLYDREETPGGGWQLMSAADFTRLKAQFVGYYNSNRGLAPIAQFQSGNCCIAVKSGQKLTISSTPYGYQFPASRSGGIRCNPTGGYTEEAYLFYRAASLKLDQTFSEKVACATSHNPAVYYKEERDVQAADAMASGTPDFGFFDAELAPGEGWQLMTASDLVTHRLDFVNAYNYNGGIQVIRPFRSGNCCFAVAGGMKYGALLLGQGG